MNDSSQYFQLFKAFLLTVLPEKASNGQVVLIESGLGFQGFLVECSPIYHLYLLNLCRVVGAGVYPISLWVRSRIHHGQVASLSQE